MSILLNAQLLLFSITVPQANIMVTRHVSDLKMGIGSKQTLAKFVYYQLLEKNYWREDQLLIGKPPTDHDILRGPIIDKCFNMIFCRPVDRWPAQWTCSWSMEYPCSTSQDVYTRQR